MDKPYRIAPLAPPYSADVAQSLHKWMPPGAAVEPLALFRTLARHPALSERMRPLGALFLGRRGSLTVRERELVILRTGWLCQSDYEWGQHVGIGAGEGLTDEEMARNPAGLAADGWSAFDAVLLQAADELVADHRLSDPTWAALSKRYDDQQMIELTLLVGNYVMVAGMLNSIGVEREPGVPGFP